MPLKCGPGLHLVDNVCELENPNCDYSIAYTKEIGQCGRYREIMEPTLDEFTKFVISLEIMWKPVDDFLYEYIFAPIMTIFM